MRRQAPSWWYRLKEGKRVGFGIFGLAGSVIAWINLTGKTFPVSWLVVAFIACVIVGVIAAYIRGRLKLLPEEFVNELSSDGQYVCAFCSAERLREACEMTKPVYGREYVAFDQAEQWRLKDPKAFVEIVNSAGELCACFGILALDEGFMGQFVEGIVSDTQLRADHICTWEQCKKSDRLYISGVVVPRHSTYTGSKRATVMVYAMLTYFRKMYGLRRPRTLYALAVTPESERFMKNLGFSMVSGARHRVDKCNMYVYKLSRESWNSLMNQVGDYSRMCEWQF